jgi:hypothetical protein
MPRAAAMPLRFIRPRLDSITRTRSWGTVTVLDTSANDRTTAAVMVRLAAIKGPRSRSSTGA